MTKKSWRQHLKIHHAAAEFPRPDDKAQKELAGDIQRNGQREPVTLFSIGGEIMLGDGITRLDVQEQILGQAVIDADGKLTVPHRVVELPDDKAAIAYVASLNLHRRHLKPDQKRKIVAWLLKAAPEKSNRQVAQAAGVDHKTVATVREQAEATGEIPQSKKTVGSDGKARPAKKAKSKTKPVANVVTVTTVDPPHVAKPIPLPPPPAATPPTPPLDRNDVGPASGGEIARKLARLEELEQENSRLRRENLALRSEVEELKAELIKRAVAA